jgi:hypothetical protein
VFLEAGPELAGFGPSCGRELTYERVHEECLLW